MYTVPLVNTTSESSLETRTSPVFIPREGEIVYPLTGEEPGIAIVDIPRHTYRKIGLPG